MKKLLILGTVLGCLVVYLISCTSSPVAGNGTRIGNPTIVGMIYNQDGKTPAPNATVFLRKKNSLPEIGLKKQASDIAIVTTGNDGRFEIDSVANGTYVIECNDRDNNYALYDSVEVENSDTTVNLPADTLKPAGVLSGTIILPEGSDFSRVYVLVFGIQRFSLVDSNGHFTINNLAEGHYDLRFISTLDHFETIDTALIPIVSAETTKIDVELLYNGIPRVRNLKLTYDTLSKVVTLSWNKNDPLLVTGYKIYRKAMFPFTRALSMGLGNVQPQPSFGESPSIMNQNPITDTIFRDLNPFQNQTYTYIVTAVGSSSKESTPSNEVQVTIKTPFSADTLFESDFGDFREPKGNNPKKFIFSNGIFYILTHNEVRLYDTLFNRIGTWDNFPSRPYEIATDGMGRIYVSIANFANDMYPENLASIYVFNQNGFLKRLNLTDTLDSIPPLGIEATLFTISNNGNFIFTKNTKDSIYICDSAGSILKKVNAEITFTNNGSNPRVYEGITTLATDNNNNIYVYVVGKETVVYNAEGIHIRTIASQYTGLINRICIDQRNGNIYLSSNYIEVLTPDGRKITSYALQNMGDGHIVLAGNKIYSLSTEYFYNETTGISSNGSVLKLTNTLP